MSYQDLDDDKLFLHLSSASAREMLRINLVFLPRQLQGMFTRNRAQSKYWKLQIDKNLNLEVVEHVPTIHYSPP
jgi:hypothetical protein